MKTVCIHRALLCLALSVAPTALMAQDPATLPGSPPQPPSNLPSASASSRDSTAHDSNATPGTTGLEMKDKIFLRKAAESGIAEIRFGQLAADRGASEEVKTFGAKMVADHTMLNNQMKPIADSVGVRLPKDMNKMDQAEYDKLSSLSGEDFDKEYIAIMLRAHRKDLHEFHNEAAATEETSIKEAVEKGEAIIREHTRMIVKAAREKGIAVEPSGRSTPPA